MLKYKEIANALKDKIVEEVYKEGENLPDQETLAKEYETSRVTVRKAVQILIDEGLIYTRKGAGTYVRNNIRKKDKTMSQLNGVLGTTQQENGKKVTSKILDFDVRFPTQHERELLSIKSSDPVYFIRRIRYADEEAKSIETSVLPLKIVTGLDEDILKGSIYNYIKSELNLIISAAQRVIIASKADEDDMKAFGLELGEPVLEVNQVVFLDDGRPFDVSKTRYPYTSGRIVAGINT